MRTGHQSKDTSRQWHSIEKTIFNEKNIRIKWIQNFNLE